MSKMTDDHSWRIRAAACRGLQCLGVQIDHDANENCQPDCSISTEDSTAHVFVITTREDITMFRQVLQATRQVNTAPEIWNFLPH